VPEGGAVDEADGDSSGGITLEATACDIVGVDRMEGGNRGRGREEGGRCVFVVEFVVLVVVRPMPSICCCCCCCSCCCCSCSCCCASYSNNVETRLSSRPSVKSSSIVSSMSIVGKEVGGVESEDEGGREI